MADLGSVKLTGSKELDRALRQLPPRVATNHMRAAARAAFVPIRKAARQNLQEFGRRTGKLHKAQALKINSRIDRVAREVTAKLRNTKDTFYGRFLEFGTRYIPGSRWMTRAVEANKDAALQAFRDRIWKGIQQEARRGRR